jgi:hypothetical protein
MALNFMVYSFNGLHENRRRFVSKMQQGMQQATRLFFSMNKSV